MSYPMRSNCSSAVRPIELSALAVRRSNSWRSQGPFLLGPIA
jgi:hypothetical protein